MNKSLKVKLRFGGLQDCIQKIGLWGQTMTFQIVGGQWCNREPMHLTS